MSDSPHHSESKRKKGEEAGKVKKDETKKKEEVKKSEGKKEEGKKGDPKKEESRKSDPKKEDSKRELKKRDESKKGPSSPLQDEKKKRPSAMNFEEKKDEKHHHRHSQRPSSVARMKKEDEEDDEKEEVAKKKKKGEDSSDSESEDEKNHEEPVIKEPTLDLEVMPSDPLLEEGERNPLSTMVMEGDPSDLEKALEGVKDDDINEALGESAVTLLHLAAARGNPKVTEALLKNHASCNSRDKFDNTPLHYAAYFNHLHTLTILLDHIAENSAHETKPHKSKSSKSEEANGKESVNAEVVRSLNKRNEQGITPLYFAAANGNAEMCTEMLKRGANANMTGPHNRTPLHEAVLSRNVECVTSLLKGGADLALRDTDQRTPIHYSVLLPVECRQIVVALTNPKQHFDDVDRFDYTALHYAVLQNYDDSIGLFTLVSDGSNVCIVYDLRLLMEKGKAPKIDVFPVPLRMPRHQKFTLRREDSEKILTGKPSQLYRPAPIVKKEEPAGKRVYKSEGGEKERQAANRFGFEIINSMTNVKELTPKEVEKERELANKWAEHMKTPEAWEKFVKNPKQMKSLCALGLPECVRGQVWALLGGVPDLIKKQPDTYKMLTKNIARREVAHQLDLDVKRSHLEHERFAHPYTDGQLSLFNVMRAYSLHDQTVEYTQGMSDVGGLLLMYLSEEETFWLFSQLMFDDRWSLRGVFDSGFPLLKQHCYVQTQLLAKYHPQILRHMKKVDFDPCMLQPHAMEWFMTLYIRVLPYAFTVRIFDVLLSRGYYIAFRVAMGLFELMKKDILAQKEFPDLMQLLKNPTESCPYIAKMSPDEFMKVVMHYKVTQKMVDKYVAQYKKSQSKK